MGAFTLITGASAGIGRELARLCAEHGRDVILVARSEDKLESLGEELRTKHGVRVEVLVQDLSLPSSVENTWTELRSREIEVEALINNAGFGSLGSFHETDRDTQLNMLRLNIHALTDLTHRCIPSMIAKGRGRILNVASVAGFQPGPFMATYYASKAYVLSFSEALAEELRGTGVTVTALCPGPVRTDFQARAGMDSAGLARIGMADAHSVAEAGYHGMERGKAIVVPGFGNRLLTILVRLSPRAAVRRAVRYLNLAN